MVQGPLYGRFMGFYVNGFLSIGKPLYAGETVYTKTHKTAINRLVDHTGKVNELPQWKKGIRISDPVKCHPRRPVSADACGMASVL